jgi:hypothetical protein
VTILISFINRTNKPALDDTMEELKPIEVYWPKEEAKGRDSDPIPEPVAKTEPVDVSKSTSSISTTKQATLPATDTEASQKEIDLSEFMKSLKSNPKVTYKSISHRNDNYFGKLMECIEEKKNEYLLEKVILHFDAFMPLTLMKKINPNRILSFSFLHIEKATTPLVETIFTLYMSNDRIDLVSEMLNHLSVNDLVHLYYSVLSKDAFLRGSYSSSFYYNTMQILQANLTGTNQDLFIEYVEKIVNRFHKTTSEHETSLFNENLAKVFDHLNIKGGYSRTTSQIFNTLTSSNYWALAEKLYLKDTSSINIYADRPSVAKLKALSCRFAQSAKPVATESIESLKKENAELKAKNAELRKQLDAAQKTQGSVVKFSDPAVGSKLASSDSALDSKFKPDF